MSLTRKMLAAMGIEADKIDQIIEGHTETVQGLKDEAAKYKADAESLPAVAKERDDWKTKHDDLLKKQPDAAKVQADFDAYKKDVETKEANAKKSAALWEKLLAEGANPDAKDLLLYGADLDGITLDEKGEADVTKTADAIKAKFPKYIGTVTETGAQTRTPPSGGAEPDYSKMTDKEYFAQADAKREAQKKG